MTTPRTRTLVSRVSRAAAISAALAAAMTAALALGACARGPFHAAGGAPAPVQGPPLAVQFDNEAQVRVDVYLVGTQREWRLGRVEPGARAALRLPAAALEEGAGFVRLAALADAPTSVQAARDPRAALTIAQPASMLVSQRWRFSQRQFSSPQLLGGREAGRP